MSDDQQESRLDRLKRLLAERLELRKAMLLKRYGEEVDDEDEDKRYKRMMADDRCWHVLSGRGHGSPSA
jgi:hypothetical protein